MKKYKVKGICLVPTEAEMIIEAFSSGHALKKAMEAFDKGNKRCFILENSSDECSAYDWEPTAEEIAPVVAEDGEGDCLTCKYDPKDTDVRRYRLCDHPDGELYKDKTAPCKGWAQFDKNEEGSGNG